MEVRRTLLLVLMALLGAACGDPATRRSKSLYELAEEQIANGRFTPALDTLARAGREGSESEAGRRARLLRVGLLGGLARGYRAMGETYLEGWKAAGEAPHASRLRATAMDYFGRARNRSLELIEALDALLRSPPPQPLPLDFSLPAGPAEEPETLAQIRQGQPVADRDRTGAERQLILAGVRQSLSQLAGTRGEPQRVALGDFYLGAGRELIELSRIYGPEALRTPRLLRLYHQRAQALAERAGELAEQAGNDRMATESRELQQYCRKVLQGS